MHGKGVYTWPTGQSYEGEYKNDIKDGFGCYRWKDGKLFIGEWKNNKRNGKGMIRYTDGTEREGLWEDDKQVSWEDSNTSLYLSKFANQSTILR
jgi:hypothetical protein